MNMSILKNRKLVADADRWRYTQQEGYFCCNGGSDGVSVGVLKYDTKGEQLPLTHCIEGRGNTLKIAIDNARRKRRK